MGFFVFDGINHLFSRRPPSTQLQPLQQPSNSDQSPYSHLLLRAHHHDNPFHIRFLALQAVLASLSPTSHLLYLTPHHTPPTASVFDHRTGTRHGMVRAVLDAFVPEPSTNSSGDSQTSHRTVCVLALDVISLSPQAVYRHLRIARTVCHSKPVALVLLHVRHPISIHEIDLSATLSDLHIYAKSAGFVVEYSKSLAAIAEEHNFRYRPSEYAQNVEIALLSPSKLPSHPPLMIDNTSEVSPSNSSEASSEDHFEREIHFSLATSRIPPHLRQPENSVILIGSHSCFGSWDPANAPRMGSPDASNVHLTINCPVAESIEYKYAIISDGGVCWEYGCNRELCTRHLKTVDIFDDWR